MSDILLIEPNYKNKYPPLGLMKIATFHKLKNDNVRFYKGDFKNINNDKKWDRVYISTLFTFQWKKIIDTINKAKKIVKDERNIYIGGVAATLLADEIEKETGIKPVKGLLNEKGKLGYDDDHIIDELPPDYEILEHVDYKYPVNDAYIAYCTRGCKNNCEFCAVNILEPEFIGYIPLKKQIDHITRSFGEKKDLLLLDNNVLASPHFSKIIEEIKECGFYKGATFNGKKRYVDFNQGLDARFLTPEKAKLLGSIAIKPARIAFDDIKFEKIYRRAIYLCVENGIEHLSNYILFNFKDKPEDFYRRLQINIELNEELGVKIYSFPMKYIPLYNKDRKHEGKYWNKKILRGIQCILNATHGVVGPKRKFFERAFGESYEEFLKIVLMPEDYIIYREKHKETEAKIWNMQYERLSASQRREFIQIIKENKFDRDILYRTEDRQIRSLLEHYVK
jgi:hypothetical protein